jgi:undecaprenyl pyrophosphate phosphatase UppP
LFFSFLTKTFLAMSQQKPEQPMVKRSETTRWLVGVSTTGVVSLGAFFGYVFSGATHHSLVTWSVIFFGLFLWIWSRRNQLTEKKDELVDMFDDI